MKKWSILILACAICMGCAQNQDSEEFTSVNGNVTVTAYGTNGESVSGSILYAQDCSLKLAFCSENPLNAKGIIKLSFPAQTIGVIELKFDGITKRNSLSFGYWKNGKRLVTRTNDPVNGRYIYSPAEHQECDEISITVGWTDSQIRNDVFLQYVCLYNIEKSPVAITTKDGVKNLACWGNPPPKSEYSLNNLQITTANGNRTLIFAEYGRFKVNKLKGNCFIVQNNKRYFPLLL